MIHGNAFLLFLENSIAVYRAKKFYSLLYTINTFYRIEIQVYIEMLVNTTYNYRIQLFCSDPVQQTA